MDNYSYYKTLIENGYKYWLEWGCRDSETKYNFLADAIFDICTYENLYSAKMAEEFLEVCVAIANGKTFDMISTEAGNALYLRTINYDFFQTKIEWGCSIRGAWWDWKIKIESCYLINGKGEQVLELNLEQGIKSGEMHSFVQALFDFVEKED
ncbi:hypothetical protein NVP1161O_145 [Vibrio phage 1.161.O._10N.261.48.C5]|nr:hypothetical protein NVP1161O_145 [Vibrio phage 1.161.O._10N.261.48.C5]